MSTLDIVRAWKDEEYCESLSETQRASLPQNPAGIVELSDTQLSAAGGGAEEELLSITLPICPTFYMCSLTICLTFTITIEAA